MHIADINERRQPEPGKPVACIGIADIDVWADIVVAFWADAIAAGDAERQAPFYLVLPGVCSARFVYTMTRAIESRAAQVGGEISYCVRWQVTPDIDTTHPYLASLLDAGVLEIGDDNAATVNPLVVIAPGMFSQLPHEMLHAHYGRLFTPTPNGAGGYEWEPLVGTAVSDDRQALLDRYRTHVPSAPIALPQGALEAINNWSRRTAGRYLLIALDRGFAEERQLREASAPSGVNFHALSLYQEGQGADVWNVQAHDQAPVCHIALRGIDLTRYVRTASTVCAHVMHAADGDTLSALAADVAAAGKLNAVLTLLQRSHFDAAVLQAAAPGMLAAAWELSSEQRWRWCEALDAVWLRHFPTQDDDAWFDIGCLAMRLEYWGLAQSAFETGRWLHGDDAVLLQRLAQCRAYTGRMEGALALIEHARVMAPTDASIAAWRDEIARWHASIERYMPLASDNELSLEPLHERHAPAMFYQYRDPQIGIMTRLPEIETVARARQWIEEQTQEAGRLTFAVMHQVFGFVGIVSVRAASGAGYFYFWIGADFQGAGFGQRAARLLFTQARRSGINTLYTSAYTGNVRSQQALRALNFQLLSVHAHAPDEDLQFFYRPLTPRPAVAEASLARRLARLCREIDSPIQLNLPQRDRWASEEFPIDFDSPTGVQA